MADHVDCGALNQVVWDQRRAYVREMVGSLAKDMIDDVDPDTGEIGGCDLEGWFEAVLTAGLSREALVGLLVASAAASAEKTTKRIRQVMREATRDE